MNQYFKEIGARVKPVSNKLQSTVTHVAKLKLPLELPRQKQYIQRR